MRHFIRIPFFLCTLLLIALTVVLTQSAHAQTYTVLHNFSGGQDGAFPSAGLTMDRAGNLYGTANGGGTGPDCSYGGAVGCGTVFKLSHKGSGWVFNPLYSFQGGNDGEEPKARVVIGPSGDLYGTTEAGGPYQKGTVFNLKPSAHACTTALCGWTESVLHSFMGTDGQYPLGDLVFDQAGNLYGTTSNAGTVYELTPSNGAWTETILYGFSCDGFDACSPRSGVIFDRAGNLYGTTIFGPGQDGGAGTVYELTQSGSGWAESIIHDFRSGLGLQPVGGLIMDRSGNLYGTTAFVDYRGGGGTVFELAPSNGTWTLTTLYSFSGNGPGPESSLIMDAVGNLYGTTYGDGTYGYGNVFKLTPSGDGWTYTDLYDFTGGSDGALPLSNVVFDGMGNLYGTTASGGTGPDCSYGAAVGCGVVWEITP